MYKNYNMNQLVLPINLEVKLQDNDIAFVINDLVESIPDEAFHNFLQKTGRPSYHPRMMLKIILCAYSQSVFSGRKIEALLKDSIRMMWLAQGHEPSYRTINRFRVDPDVKDILRELFVQFRSHLVKEKIIDNEAIFIDGTKIEANANKFTFVWKKSIKNFSDKLIENSNKMYDELLEKEIIPAIERENSEELSVHEMEEIVEKLDEKVNEYNQKIEECEIGSERKKIRSKRKYPKQALKKFKDFIKRKNNYEKAMEILGDRNSYSKTDPDATFMRMKDDYMKNGQLKPGYNVQIATEGQYALAYDIFPNPTDTRTLIPFLDKIESQFFQLPKYIVADAGYGGEANYIDIIENRNRIPLITYNSYLREQKRKYKKDRFNTANWDYNEEHDYYVCPNGQKLTFQYHSHRTDRYGFKRKLKVYQSENCDGCPLRTFCTKAKEGNNRKLYVNETWEKQKEYIRAKLSEEETGEIYKKRKIDVEPVFGFLKANLSFSRFSVRGKSKVENELGFALMAVNLRKYTAMSNKDDYKPVANRSKKRTESKFSLIQSVFSYRRLVLSQPLFLLVSIKVLGENCPLKIRREMYKFNCTSKNKRRTSMEVMVMKGKRVLFLLFLIIVCSLFPAGVNREAKAFSEQVIQHGAFGEDVIELQARLKYIGFYTGEIDGVFGWRTYWALRNFQYEFGLPVDGLAGKATKDKLVQVTEYDEVKVKAEMWNVDPEVVRKQLQGKTTQQATNQKQKQPQTNQQQTGAQQVPTGTTKVNVPHGFSQNDINLMANAVYGEARGEPYEGQVAVAAVILNRLKSPIFPDTVSGVIFEPRAFTAVADGQIWLTPDETAKRAVLDAINGWDPSGNALYYFNPETATSPWIWTRPQIKRIGKHIFCK